MCTACFRNKLSEFNPYSICLCFVWLSKWTPIHPNSRARKSKMVTDLFSCEIIFVYCNWSWVQKGLDAETDCHLQSKLILDSAVKGLCHLQKSYFLDLRTHWSCVNPRTDGVVGEWGSQEISGVTEVESGNWWSHCSYFSHWFIRVNEAETGNLYQ